MQLSLSIISKQSALALPTASIEVDVRGSNRVLIDCGAIDDLGKEVEFVRSPLLVGMITRSKADVHLSAQKQATQDPMLRRPSDGHRRPIVVCPPKPSSSLSD